MRTPLIPSIALSVLLVAPSLAHDGAGHQHSHPAAAAPALPEHSLILPAYLPHVMPIILRETETLNLSASQKDAFKIILAEVPAAIRPKFAQARALEQEIARAVLHGGATVQTVAPQLDELGRLKREAAAIHIDCIARVRGILDAQQYARLLDLAKVAP